MHTVAFLRNLVEHHETLVYLIIFAGLIFEGEFTLISAGILIHLQAIDIPLTVAIVIVGSLIKTFYCYYLGALIYEKWNHKKFLKYIEKRVLYVLPHFRTRPFWSIFVSKFIMWMNFSVIIFSGYSKINLKTYLKAELLATAIWLPLLLTMGYFFSYTALHVSREIWRFSLIILLLVLGFIILDKLMTWLFEVFEEFYDDIT